MHENPKEQMYSIQIENMSYVYRILIVYIHLNISFP